MKQVAAISLSPPWIVDAGEVPIHQDKHWNELLGIC